VKFTGTERQLIHILKDLIEQGRTVISPRKLYAHTFKIRAALLFEEDSNDEEVWRELTSHNCSKKNEIYYNTKDAAADLKQHTLECEECAAVYNHYKTAAEQYGDLAVKVSRCMDAHGRLKEGKYRWRRRIGTWQHYKNLDRVLERLASKGLISFISEEERAKLMEKFNRLQIDLQLFVDADLIGATARPSHQSGPKVILHQKIVEVNPCTGCTKRLKCAMRG